MRKVLWAFQIFLLLFLISGCGHKVTNPLNLKINDFTFTNQDNEQVSLTDYQEKVWIADFIFTNCTTVCIPMMSNMVNLQDELNNRSLDIDFVSFTVDPEFDKPEVLKSYAEEYHVDFSNWNFLTGYSQTDLENFAMNSFKTYAKKTALDEQVIHATSFFLVDKNGVVMKEYSGLDILVDDIIKDIQYLLSKK